MGDRVSINFGKFQSLDKVLTKENKEILHAKNPLPLTHRDDTKRPDVFTYELRLCLESFGRLLTSSDIQK